MIYEIKNFSGLSDYEDRGIVGAFKFASNIDVRKSVDSLSCQQALKEEGSHVSESKSPSASRSRSPSLSASNTPSSSASLTPSPTYIPASGFALLQENYSAILQENNDYILLEGLGSPSQSPSTSISATKSESPSASVSLSPSVSISATMSASPSATKSASPSATASESASISASKSVSISGSPSSTRSLSPSASVSLSQSLSVSLSASASISHSPSASPSPSSSISPSPSPLFGLETVFTGLIKWFVKSTDGNTYGFDDTGVVYKRDSTGTWTRVYKDADGEIKGAAEWYNESNAAYIYFATDTKLKRKAIPGLSNWNDVTTVATTLTSADSHMMRECGGSLIIANGEFLALVGRDESFTNEAVDLVPGNIATTIVERNGRTIVGCARKADPDKSVNAAIDSEVPLAQVGNDGEIFYANMNDTVPVKRFPGGGKCNPGGVANLITQVNFFEWEQDALSWIDKQAVGNLAVFGVYGATTGKNGLYTYGRKNKNKPFVLNLDYQLEADEIGAVEVVNGLLIASYRSDTYYGVVVVDNENKATGTYEGLDFKAPVKLPVDITHWKTAEIFCQPLRTGESIEFYYRVNKYGDFVQAKTAEGAANFSTIGAKKAVFRINAEGEIYEPKLVLNPNGNNSPEVYRIRTYFN